MRGPAWLSRARRGWAPVDVANGDVHVARVVGEMAAYLRDHAQSMPDDRTAGGWAAELDRIARPLLAYAAADNETDEQVEEARQALRLLADCLPHLWD